MSDTTMDLTPEDDLTTATKAVLQMFMLGRDGPLTDQDRRSLGAALRHAAWESRSELRLIGPGGGWMMQRMQDMAELIGGPASEEELRIDAEIVGTWRAAQRLAEG